MGYVSKITRRWFKWVKKLSKFNENFIKNYNGNSDIGYFLEVDVQYWKELSNIHKDLPFLSEKNQVNKLKSLFIVQKTKENMLSI